MCTAGMGTGWQKRSQSTQSAGPVRFLIFCSINIFLLAGLVAGSKPQWAVAGNVLHRTYPLEYQICSSQPRHKSCVGPALYIISLLGRDAHLPPTLTTPCLTQNCTYVNISRTMFSNYWWILPQTDHLSTVLYILHTAGPKCSNLRDMRAQGRKVVTSLWNFKEQYQELHCSTHILHVGQFSTTVKQK